MEEKELTEEDKKALEKFVSSIAPCITTCFKVQQKGKVSRKRFFKIRIMMWFVELEV